MGQVYEMSLLAYDVIQGLFHFKVEVFVPSLEPHSPVLGARPRPLVDFDREPKLTVTQIGVYPLGLPPRLSPATSASPSASTSLQHSHPITHRPGTDSPTPTFSHSHFLQSIGHLAHGTSSGPARGFISAFCMGDQGLRAVWVERRRGGTTREIQVWSRSMMLESMKRGGMSLSWMLHYGTDCVEMEKSVVYTNNSYDLRGELLLVVWQGVADASRLYWCWAGLDRRYYLLHNIRVDGYHYPGDEGWKDFYSASGVRFSFARPTSMGIKKIIFRIYLHMYLRQGITFRVFGHHHSLRDASARKPVVNSSLYLYTMASRATSCARSALSKFFTAPSTSRTWNTGYAVRQLSNRRDTIPMQTFKMSRRPLTTTLIRHNVSKPLANSVEAQKNASTPSEVPAASASAPPASIPGEPSYKDDPKMAIAFTCTVPKCGHRQAHVFSKRSYEKGIVIITCDGCKNRCVALGHLPMPLTHALDSCLCRHLIADHLGWFDNLTGDGAHVTIEALAKAQGQKIARGVMEEKGVFEFSGEAEEAAKLESKQ